MEAQQGDRPAEIESARYLVQAAIPQDVQVLMRALRERGATLWLDAGRLRFRAPKGALSEGDVQQIRQQRTALIALLEATDELPRPGDERSATQLDYAPLSFSQLQHWNLYRLAEWPASRHVASALLLNGKLDSEAFRRAVNEVVHRHAALRTRVVVRDQIPVQQVVSAIGCALIFEDASGIPAHQQAAYVEQRIESVIIDPIDVADGPLSEFRLMRLNDVAHALIVATEHLISDMHSLQLIVRDLFTAYSQLVSGRELMLPDVPIQFPEYAAYQRGRSKYWLVEHGAYWDERMSGCDRVRFPDDTVAIAQPRKGWSGVPLQIDAELRSRLQEWCRVNRTTMVMSLFAAYAALVLRWCGVVDCVIQFQTNGRSDPRVANSVGYFACPLSLRIELSRADRFSDLLARVTEEYCRAQEHADYSYLESRTPRPEFTRNTAFNWVSDAAEEGRPVVDHLPDPLTLSPITFDNALLKHLERDTEPLMLFGEEAMSALMQCKGGAHEAVGPRSPRICGGVYFPLDRFTHSTMERFARNYLSFIETLVTLPAVRVKDITLRP